MARDASARPQRRLRLCRGVVRDRGGAPLIEGTDVRVLPVVKGFDAGLCTRRVASEFDLEALQVESALRFALLNPGWYRRMTRRRVEPVE